MSAFASSPASTAASTGTPIEVAISCRGLPNLDRTSKTDPFAVVTLCSNEADVACDDQGHVTIGGMLVLKELGTRQLGGELLVKTEVIHDTLNPDFHTSFKTNYAFEKSNQILMVKVYDEDVKGSQNIADHELVGVTYITVGQLMGAPGNCVTRELRVPGKSGDFGTVTLRAEEVVAILDTVKLQFVGMKLANKDGFFGKSDPFLQISRVNEDGSYTLVHKTEVVMDNLSPTWKEEELSVSMLCNGDFHRPLRLQIFDWDSDGSHDDMGFVDTTLQHLVSTIGRAEARLPVKCGGKAAGQIYAAKATVVPNRPPPTLTTYMSGGLQLSLMVAVDYTQSNGSVNEPTSLHYLDPNAPNQYQKAIEAIGAIMEPYDSDKKFPIWGFGGFGSFGGKPKHCSHCFDLSTTGEEVHGSKGLLDAYSESFTAEYGLNLYGPTNFQPVIEKARAHSVEVARANNGQAYSVLLIITDGAITDMKATKHSIIDACDEPLSIIIIGVGGYHFKEMNVLDGDGDEKLKTHDGKVASRDLVQFVPFNQHATNPADLANATLAELPGQVVEYLKGKGIQPLPKPDAALAAGVSGMTLAA
jgi:hypothetical protein